MYSWNFLKTFKRGRHTQPLDDAPQGDKADTTRVRGMRAEDRALHLLMRAGLELLTRNYRTPGRGGGEIDLIMRERDGTVVFVEVRSRNRHDFGGAGASIGAVKQRRIILAARHYLAGRRAAPPCRFDVVLLEPEPHWLKGAFDASAAQAR